MIMRSSSEKHIAGVPPHLTFLWLGALPKADALMNACVPRCVSLMLANVKEKKKVLLEVIHLWFKSPFWSAATLELLHVFIEQEKI